MLLTVVKQIVKLSNLLISNLFLSDNPSVGCRFSYIYH